MSIFSLSASCRFCSGMSVFCVPGICSVCDGIVLSFPQPVNSMIEFVNMAFCDLLGLLQVACGLELQRMGERDSQETQTCHPHHTHKQARPGMEEHGHRDHLIGRKMQQSGENE